MQNHHTFAPPGSHAPPPECDVAVVVPVYRNADTLIELAQRIRMVMEPTGLTHRLLFVVDASPDNAWTVVQSLARNDSRVAGLLLATNQGQHRAVLSGMAQISARWLAIMDADLQDLPEHLPELIATCEASNVTVFARRAGAYQSLGRMWTSRIFKTLLGLLLRMPADVGTYLVIPWHVSARMQRACIVHPQVVVMARAFSPGWRGVPLARKPRLQGSSAYTALGRVKAAIRGLRCAWECRGALNSERTASTDHRPTPAAIAAKVNL